MIRFEEEIGAAGFQVETANDEIKALETENPEITVEVFNGKYLKLTAQGSNTFDIVFMVRYQTEVEEEKDFYYQGITKLGERRTGFVSTIEKFLEIFFRPKN